MSAPSLTPEMLTLIAEFGDASRNGDQLAIEAAAALVRCEETETALEQARQDHSRYNRLLSAARVRLNEARDRLVAATIALDAEPELSPNAEPGTYNADTGLYNAG